eukprot:3652726-Pleurochrysis_carterae.AAC.3
MWVVRSRARRGDQSGRQNVDSFALIPREGGDSASIRKAQLHKEAHGRMHARTHMHARISQRPTATESKCAPFRANMFPRFPCAPLFKWRALCPRGPPVHQVQDERRTRRDHTLVVEKGE